MGAYLDINRAAYDALAAEYDRRVGAYRVHRGPALTVFRDRLQSRFSVPISVFEVGCGPGLDALILTEFGFTVGAIDFSQEMVAYARRRAPLANISQGDILSHEPAQRYQGVLLSGVLHLFPSDDVPLVLDRVKRLLVPGGIAAISTTKEASSSEGVRAKQGYGIEFERFRRKYTKQDFRDTLCTNGLSIIEYWEHGEEREGVIWMEALVEVA